MNRNDFIDMIGYKVQVSRQTIGEIYELINVFPYFQSAHLLLLKGLKENGDVKFDNQLRNSAIHVADREILYYLLKEKISGSAISPESETVVAEPSPAVSHENQTLAADHQEIIELPVKLQQPDEIVQQHEPESQADTGQPAGDHQQVVIESARNSEELINEIEQGSDIINKERQGEGDGFHSHSILVSNESETIESEGVMRLTDEDEIPDEDRIFYMDPGFSVPDNSDLLELDIEEPVDDRQKESIPVAELQGGEEEKETRLTQTKLIDRFILANPRIEPIREPANIPQDDLSKPSADTREGFVTETLAKIYINQGYYSRAIDIYEKLSLKFPEKSSYFAAQIEKIKEYLKK